MTETPTEKPNTLQLDQLPKGTVIRVGGAPEAVQARPNNRENSEALGRHTIPLITAGVGGIGAMEGGRAVAEYQINKMLLPFDTKVAEATVKEIRDLGLSGGFASTSSVATDGSGIAGGIIKERNYLRMLQQPENAFARFVHNIGGRRAITGAISLAAGTVGALAGWLMFAGMFAGKKKDDQSGVSPVSQDAVIANHAGASHTEQLAAQNKESWQQRVENGSQPVAVAPVK